MMPKYSSKGTAVFANINGKKVLMGNSWKVIAVRNILKKRRKK